MFTNKDYPCLKLADITESWQKGQPFKKDDIITNGKQPCIHYGELFTQYGTFIEDILSRTDSEPIRTSKTGDILFPASDVTPVGLTKCSALLMEGVILGGDIIIMRPYSGNNPVYLSYAIRMEKDQLLSRITGSVVRHISAKSLQSVTIIVPPVAIQNEFETLIRQSDKSKFELQEAITNLKNLLKSLLKEDSE